MTTTDPRDERAARRAPTLADVVARQLARLGLMWATRWILGGLVLAIALCLVAAFGFLLIAIFWLGGLVGLTSSGGSTALLLPALVLSGLILFLPTRWAARNLLRTERALEAGIDRLAIPTALDPGTIVEHRATTPADLAALDARLAPRPPETSAQPSSSPSPLAPLEPASPRASPASSGSGAGERLPQEPDR